MDYFFGMLNTHSERKWAT